LEHLDAKTFDEGAASSFSKTKITGKLREYAIAGALHLDHLAGLQASRADAQTLELNVFQLSRSSVFLSRMSGQTEPFALST